MTRLEILENELFKDVPYLSRDAWFSFAWDDEGRELIIPCKTKADAVRKQELAHEYLAILEGQRRLDDMEIVFEPEFGPDWAE